MTNGSVVGAIDRHDVVGRDAAGFRQNEAAAQLVVVAREDQLALIGIPALHRRLAIERFMGPNVVLVLDVMTQPKLQRAEVRIDIGAGQAPQHVVLGGLVESLDLPVPFGITLAPVDEADVEPHAHRVRVIGNEAGAPIEVQHIHLAEVPENLEQAAQQQRRAFK